MKIATAPQDVAVHGNFQTSDFSIGDVAFIVDMFADKVYSHKERAVIRELACNAHDSHVMAGTKNVPFNVHLPTTLEPWFSVRDFGTGLSDHEIRTVFAGIGISTKRNSNEVIGCFGIGSLSPYSLADSFTVVSYYNGTMRTYTCYRDEQRKPVVALLTEVETSEPNGLEVSLSVKGRVGAFEEEAERVFRFWEGTLPNINNKQVAQNCERQRAKYIFQGDNFGLSNGYGEMYAVMGNIAYKIPYELDELRCDGYLKFNLGELEFDTARENLSMTDKVRAAISQKFNIVKQQICDLAIAQVESAQTTFDKAVIADRLNRGHLGSALRKAELGKYALPLAKDNFDYWQSRSRGHDKGSSKTVPVGSNVEYYLHEDRMGSRIKSYLKDKHSGFTIVVFKSEDQARECCVPVNILRNLSDLPKAERVSSGSGTTSTVKTFAWTGKDHWKANNNWEETSIDIDGDEIVYVELLRFNPISNGHISSSNHNIKSTFNTMRECGLATPELVGLKSAFLTTKQFKKGNFIHLDDYVKREFKKIAPKVIYEYSSNQMTTLSELNKHIVHDDVAEIVSKKRSNKDETIAAVCENFRVEFKDEMKIDNSVQVLIDQFFDKYSMLILVDNYEISRNKNIIAKYLGGKVK